MIGYIHQYCACFHLFCFAFTFRPLRLQVCFFLPLLVSLALRVFFSIAKDSEMFFSILGRW